MIDLLRLKLREHMNYYADQLAGGAAVDFADYKRQTGIIAGLALAEAEMLDLLKRAETEDFEE